MIAQFQDITLIDNSSLMYQKVNICSVSKDRPTRRGGGVALCVREQLECIELGLGVDEEGVESLWVRIKGQAHMGDITVGVYYRPPDQGEEIDEAFYRQLQAASQSQALVSHGGLQPP